MLNFTLLCSSLWGFRPCYIYHIEKFPVAVHMQDKFEKTPLVLACSKAGNDALRGTNERRNKISSCSPLSRVIQKICTVCRKAIISEDDKEMSALKHVIVNGVDSKIVSSLKKATSETQRKLFWTKDGINLEKVLINILLKTKLYQHSCYNF